MSKLKATEQDLTVSEPIVHTKKKKLHRGLNIAINSLLIVAIAFAILGTYVSFTTASGKGVPGLFGLSVFSVQSDSMTPVFKSGDLIIDASVKDASELRENDIITYWTVIDGERVLNTHRIEAIYDGGGYLIFKTKGDNNAASDPMTVHESEIVGKYRAKLSGMGNLFDLLQTSIGFMAVVVVPVFIFFLYHLVRFIRVLFEYQTAKNGKKSEADEPTQKDKASDSEIPSQADRSDVQ